MIPVQLSDKEIPDDLQAKLGNKPLASTFLFFDEDGELVGTFLIAGRNSAKPLSVTDVTNFAAGYLTVKSGLDDWSKAKSNDAKAAALRKIGAAPTEKGKAILLTAAESSNPEVLRKAAVTGLAKQQSTSSILVEFLTDKVPAVRLAASSGLKTQGPSAIPSLFQLLSSDEADYRAAAVPTLSALVQNGTLTKNVTFWHSAKAADRDAALQKLQEWMADKYPELTGKPES